MKTSTCFPSRLAAFGAALALLVTGTVRAEFKAWSSRSGATLEAELVGRDGDTVRLKKRDGREVAIALTNLGAECQGWVPTGGVAAASPAAKQNRHQRAGETLAAEWSCDAWDALLFAPQGRMVVVPKSAGKPVGLPLQVELAANYQRGGPDWKPIRFVSENGPVEKVGERVRFAMNFEQGLQAETWFRREGRDLICGYSIAGDVKALGQHTIGLQVSVPALYRTVPQKNLFESELFPEVKSWDALVPKLAAMEVVNLPEKGSRQRFPFAETAHGVIYGSRSVDVNGLLAPWQLRFTKFAPKSPATLQLYLYAGMTPAQGVRVLLKREDADLGQPAGAEAQLMRLSFAPPK